jgi:hypothetical protein
MPSASLIQWQSNRMPRLHQVELQCAAVLAAPVPNPDLLDENLRGYVLLLSAHFQGYCRDLHTEAAQIIASKVRASLRALIQTQFTAHRKLNQGNPNVENLRADFERFGHTLDLAAGPANATRLANLAAMNKWRNIAAHHGTPLPTGVPLNLPALQSWRNSCDGLATSLDSKVYNILRTILKRNPW